MNPAGMAGGALGTAGRQGLYQVLLLTADAEVAGAVADQLAPRGVHVSRAEAADDLEILLSAMQFDAVVVDAAHPEAAAAQLLRKAGAAPPFVVISANDAASVRETSVADLGFLLETQVLVPVPRETHGHPVNVDSFLARVNSDRDFFNSLAADLLDDLNTKIPELTAAVAAGDCPRVEFLAHSLKSVLALFGAEEASSVARDIETAAHRGEPGGADEVMKRFVGEIDRIRAQMREILPE